MSSLMWMDILDDDSEEQNRETNLYNLRRRRILRDSSNPLEMDDILFEKNFRLTKCVFVNLLDEIDPKFIESARSIAIPNILKLACFLSFCAQGSHQRTVGDEYHIALAQSTVCKVLTETINIMEEHICPKWINFNYSQEEENEAKRYFYQKSGIPGIIGCIDGTHIKIRGPEKHLHHLYYNRNGFFSLNTMLVCNHKMIIKYVSARFPGTSQDAMVWNKSSLKKHLDEKYNNNWKNTFILGDAGYPLLPYLITPYRSTENNSREARFNSKHSKARNIIVRTIGLLKNRFKCLLGTRELHYKPAKATQIINICVALHNICIQHNITHDEAIHNVEIDDSPSFMPQELNAMQSEGNTIRNGLMNSIL